METQRSQASFQNLVESLFWYFDKRPYESECLFRVCSSEVQGGADGSGIQKKTPIQATFDLAEVADYTVTFQ